ncbi:MAG: hypothetical protein IKZ48_06780 [Prevotella sp.]|nr:hypothetical protein [Prevotella sp.]
MKKRYIEPAVLITYVEPLRMTCSSVLGVTGTGNMDTEVSDEETDEYLTRRNYNLWDEEDEEEEEYW